MKLLYTSDLHGNSNQYELLFAEALNQNISDIVIGGDITPKKNPSPLAQKKFLTDEFLPLVHEYKSKLDLRLFIILGNDDWACCEEAIRKDSTCFLIHNNPVKLSEKFNIVGYSYVPITPFELKDWEKWDVEKKTELIRKDNLCGFKGSNLEEFCFDPEDRTDCIENDLKKLAEKSDSKKTIYVFHAPPFNTNLDILTNGKHIGSLAIREFIEKHQPLLTLHGHIHESVEVSGKHTDRIGETVCASSGNDNKTSDLAILSVDLENIRNIQRKIIQSHP